MNARLEWYNEQSPGSHAHLSACCRYLAESAEWEQLVVEIEESRGVADEKRFLEEVVRKALVLKVSWRSSIVNRWKTPPCMWWVWG